MALMALMAANTHEVVEKGLCRSTAQAEQLRALCRRLLEEEVLARTAGTTHSIGARMRPGSLEPGCSEYAWLHPSVLLVGHDVRTTISANTA